MMPSSGPAVGGEGVPVLACEGIMKTYDSDPPVAALTDVRFSVREGQRVAIVGRSGSGKSTLLNILGLLDDPSSGEYSLLGRRTRGMSPKEIDRVRAKVIGFVFQDAHVLGHRTVYENVDLKLAVNRVPYRLRQARIAKALEDVRLSHRSAALGRLLSGGEKQRLAIARALVTGPQVLLADEPTGNLDEVNTRTVMRLFDDAATRGVAVIVITHDRKVAEWADRTYELNDGRLVSTEVL
jgi:ABC-type lipoprotein export system ATPase subunit